MLMLTVSRQPIITSTMQLAYTARCMQLCQPGNLHTKHALKLQLRAERTVLHLCCSDALSCCLLHLRLLSTSACVQTIVRPALAAANP
jgi:hypothetical protein